MDRGVRGARGVGERGPCPAAGPSATGWSTYSVPVTGTAALDGIVATGRDDAWAGGFTMNLGGTPVPAVADRDGNARPTAGTCDETGEFDSVMLRWNGTRWRQADIPDVGRIDQMSAAGPRDVWALADCGLLHWNGRNWATTAVPEPSSSSLQAGAEEVTADRPDDAWLVGSTYDNTTGDGGGFVDHWNGKAWRRVPLPALGTVDYSLDAVAANGPADVWVAGTDYTGDTVTPAKSERLILLHWNGCSWTRFPAPATGMQTQRVTGLTGISATDVWLAGWGKKTSGEDALRHPLALHWGGHHWSSTPVPARTGELFQVAPEGKDLWTLGDTFSPTVTTWGMDLLRWTGHRWVHAAVPVQGDDGSLLAAAARPGGGLWAVGTVGSSDGNDVEPVIALHA
ncbi:MAG: hypothetical protein ABSA93_13655 [Streptosporangiaceae bacterium]|jgi:hypothetical protein